MKYAQTYTTAMWAAAFCTIWSFNYLAIYASWTSNIHYPHIKLPKCPYVRTSSMAPQQMTFPLFRHNLHKLSFALRSVAEDM